MVSMDVKQQLEKKKKKRRRRRIRSCVKVEVAVLGSTSLIVLTGLCGRNKTLGEEEEESESESGAV